jgi:hypothetical protein
MAPASLRNALKPYRQSQRPVGRSQGAPDLSVRNSPFVGAAMLDLFVLRHDR